MEKKLKKRKKIDKNAKEKEEKKDEIIITNGDIKNCFRFIVSKKRPGVNDVANSEFYGMKKNMQRKNLPSSFTEQEFKKRFPFISTDVVHKLLGGPKMTYNVFKDLLTEDLTDVEEYLKRTIRFKAYDPVWESFKLLDVEKTGFMDLESLKNLLGRIYSDKKKGKSKKAEKFIVSDNDMKEILKAFDFDGDGKIGIEDYKKVLNTKFSYSLNKENFLKQMIKEVNESTKDLLMEHANAEKSKQNQDENKQFEIKRILSNRKIHSKNEEREINEKLRSILDNNHFLERKKSYEETSKALKETREELLFSFRTLDQENKGVIELNKIRQILQDSGTRSHQKILDELLSEYAKNGKTTIDFRQYFDLLSKDTEF